MQSPAKNQRRSTDGVDEGEEEAVYRRNWKRGPHVALCALSELREGGVGHKWGTCGKRLP